MVIGLTIGYYTPYIFEIQRQKENILYEFITQTSISVVIALIIIFTFKSAPKTPPSEMANVERDDDILGTYRLVLTNKDFIKVSIIYWLYASIISSVEEHLILFAEDFGYSEKKSTTFLVTFISGGILGTFVFGAALSRKKWYKRIYSTIGLLTAINLAILWILLENGKKIATIGMFFMFGFWILPNLTIWYWYASEIAFPLKETTFSGVFLIFAEISSFLASIGTSIFVEKFMNNSKGSLLVFLFLIFLALFGFLTSLFMVPVDYDKLDKFKQLASGHSLPGSSFSIYVR